MSRISHLKVVAAKLCFAFLESISVDINRGMPSRKDVLRKNFLITIYKALVKFLHQSAYFHTDARFLIPVMNDFR